jgi:uncharacterized membrane protein YsdA (DUF1294 family)
MTGRRQSPQRYWGIAGLAIAAAIAGGLVLLLDVDPYVAWLAGASVALFGFYGWDKRRAAGRGRRIPEVVLHGLALAGGFPGGWLGRGAFRHKTRQPAFLVVLLLATLLHGALIFWLLR